MPNPKPLNPDELIRSYEELGSVDKVAAKFKVDAHKVWKTILATGYVIVKNRTWSPEEEQIVKDFYKMMNERPREFNAKMLVEFLDRPLSSIYKKASAFGLTDRTRPSSKAEVEVMKENFGNDQFRQKQSDDNHRRIIQNKSENQMMARSKAGRRDDLGGLYVRSSWEANFARILNIWKAEGKIHEWAFEPEIFIFEEIKRGTRSYTPDFRIKDTPDSPYRYVEIKGYMDAKSRTKLKRMAKYFPEIPVELVEEKQYRLLEEQYAHRIPTWEYPAKSPRSRRGKKRPTEIEAEAAALEAELESAVLDA